MAAKTIFVMCAHALLLQSVLGQINYGGVNSNVVTESTVAVSSSTAAGVGNAGAGLAGIGWNNAAPLGSGLAGIGLNNAELLGSGLAGIGLNNAGLLNSGVALGNAALIGNTVAPVIGPDYLSPASFSTGGTFPITSFSSIVPNGITVVSENTIEGPIAVFGQLPFLSAVAFEGTLPSEGASTAACGCGSAGNIGIISESYTPATGPAVVAPAATGLGVGAGLIPGAGLRAETGLGLGVGRGLGVGAGRIL
ncbi:chorion class B protein Ld10-like [Galleria mellonella]|uniref:Chorion class B protein Ld10-like n=1 Tax=Galleria mellonella TaxID=7137 RepID=A0A6J1WTP1_GALME|nr:chorion class B protein Ld10-like [Galleria mellonella]